jgi:hypothetical protein
MSTVLTFICVLFFGAQMGITGFQFNIQPICQMLGGYMFHGRPLANMVSLPLPEDLFRLTDFFLLLVFYST